MHVALLLQPLCTVRLGQRRTSRGLQLMVAVAGPTKLCSPYNSTWIW